MSRPPKNIFKTLIPKTAHWDPKNQKPTPKFGQNQRVRIGGSIENKSCSAIQIDPKNVFET